PTRRSSYLSVFFPGQASVRFGCRAGRLRQLRGPLDEPIRSGYGSACHTLCGPTNPWRIVALIEKHREQEVAYRVFERAALWFGIRDEAAGGLLHRVRNALPCLGKRQN